MTSSVDFSRYQSPGVYTQPTPGPLLGIQSNTPSSVAIFGVGRGYQIDAQSFNIPTDFTDPSTSAVSPVPSAPLRQLGIDITTIVVTDVANGHIYTPQTVPSPPNGDYVIISTTGPSGVANGYDSTIQIVRVEESSGGILHQGTAVQVSYQFTNSSYFTAQKITDFDDVINLYGPPFDSTGTIISELSLAAQLAFTNGAQSVITVPVQSSGAAQVSDYVAALAKLEGVPDISVVVCANGNSAIFSYVRDHVVLQSSYRNERRAILGTDGSAASISSSTRITAAQNISNARVAVVSPSVAYYYNPATSVAQPVGSQYLAAAIAGVAVTLGPAIPLTREAIAGFAYIDPSSDSQKSTETQGGLMVVDAANSANSLRVRHGVTTDFSTLINREWSILGQQDSMSFRIRSYFDNSGLIGGIITDLTLSNVKASADSALTSLVADGTIQNYANLAVRQSNTNYDVIEIGFSWQPSLPLNYIVVRFTLNVTSGDTTSTTTAI